jgi:acyl-CoA synthetase (AMP-forming)/AMP-acid ligase II
MSCGYPQPGHAVRIVEPQQMQVLGDNQVGEIWAGGPSIALGYWRNPEASARTFVEMDGRPGCAPATWVSCATASVRHRPPERHAHRPWPEPLPAGSGKDPGA